MISGSHPYIQNPTVYDSPPHPAPPFNGDDFSPFPNTAIKIHNKNEKKTNKTISQDFRALFLYRLLPLINVVKWQNYSQIPHIPHCSSGSLPSFRQTVDFIIRTRVKVFFYYLLYNYIFGFRLSRSEISIFSESKRNREKEKKKTKTKNLFIEFEYRRYHIDFSPLFLLLSNSLVFSSDQKSLSL